VSLRKKESVELVTLCVVLNRRMGGPTAGYKENPFLLQENGSLFVGFQAHIIDVVT